MTIFYTYSAKKTPFRDFFQTIRGVFLAPGLFLINRASRKNKGVFLANVRDTVIDIKINHSVKLWIPLYQNFCKKQTRWGLMLSPSCLNYRMKEPVGSFFFRSRERNRITLTLRIYITTLWTFFRKSHFSHWSSRSSSYDEPWYFQGTLVFQNIILTFTNLSLTREVLGMCFLTSEHDLE